MSGSSTMAHPAMACWIVLLLAMSALQLGCAQPVPPDLPTSGTTAAQDLAEIQPLLVLPQSVEVAPDPDSTSAENTELVDVPRAHSAARAAAMTAALQQDAVVAITNGSIVPTATAAGATPAAASAYQGILDRHNTYRAAHGAPALAWNDYLASRAASWAAGCTFAHDSNAQAGENLYASSETTNTAGSLANAIEMWYNEVTQYDFNNPGFSSATGHFTQVVWLGSSSIGCALQVCSAGVGNTYFSSGTIIVCRYAPGGNVLGQFPQNVLRRGAGQPAPPKPPPKPVTPPQPKPIPPATLPGGYKFSSPGCLGSVNKRFWVCCQDDGNIVLFADGTAIWASNSAGRSFYRPFKLTMQTDGNLVASDNRGQRVWTSRTAGKGASPARLVVQDDGNAVIFDAANRPLWATNTGRF